MADIGALAQATDEEEEETSLDPIQALLGLGGESYEDQFLERYEESAEESRQALRDARARISAEKYDKRRMWLAAASALGKPTRTGQFGETLGNVAGALGPQFAARDQFERGQEDRLFELDQAMGKLDRGQLGTELGLRKASESQDLDRQELAFKMQETRDKNQDRRNAEIDQNLRHESGMRKEFNTLMKDYTQISDAYGRIQAASTDPSPAGDLALVFNYMKMLDPGSTVREGEFATAAKTGSTLDAMKNFFGGHVTGEILEYTRDDFVERAEALYATAKEGAQFKADSYNDMAIRNGLDPEDITAVYDAAKNRFAEEGPRIVRSDDEWDYYSDGTKARIQKRARGGRIRFQEGGRVKQTEEDLALTEALLTEAEEEEEGGLDLMDLLRTGAGAAAGTIAGPLAIEGESRLMEMAQPQLTAGTPAERKIVEAMEMGNTDPASVMQDVRRGQRLGVPQRPLDVGGPMTRVLGEKAMIAGGQEAEEALAGLQSRHEGSRERVSSQVENKFKTPEYFAEEDKLTNRLYENAKPAYEKAWRENPDLDHPPFWKRMVDNKYGEQAVHMALDFMDDIEQEPIGKKNIAGWVERPSLKFLDQVKRGFDQMIRKEENMGATPLGRHLRQMRSTLVTWLDDPKNTTPAYQQARKQYKGDLEILEALDTGRKSYLRMPTEEARLMIEGMPWAERNALRAGVTQRIYEQLDTPSSDVNAARKILGSPGTSDKLELLFDSPKEFEVFKAALRREQEIFQEGKKTIGRAERGRTSRMTGELLDQEEFTPGSVLRLAKNLRPVDWFMNLIDRKGFKLDAKEADEIIKILNEGDMKELQALEARLTKVAASRARRAAPKRNKGKAAAAGALLGGIGAFLLDGDDEEEPDMEAIGQLLEEQQ